MQGIKQGYLIEYSEKTSLFFKSEPGDNFTERRTVICSKKRLADILMGLRYVVWSAQWINVLEYKKNHPEEALEEWR